MQPTPRTTGRRLLLFNDTATTEIYTIWQQVQRAQGGIQDPHGLFWTFSLGTWLPKDTFLLAGGIGATLINLFIGLSNRKRHRGDLVAALLALSYTLYLIRGSVMLDFYIVPLVPFMALNIGMVASQILRLVPGDKRLPLVSESARALVLAGCFAVLIVPMGGYVLVHDQYHKTVLHDLYRLPLTTMQDEQVAFIRAHIPPDARIIMDDDLWVQLHDVQPFYPRAHSHWKASSDPPVRDKLLYRDCPNIHSNVMATKNHIDMHTTNTR